MNAINSHQTVSKNLRPVSVEHEVPVTDHHHHHHHFIVINDLTERRTIHVEK